MQDMAAVMAVEPALKILREAGSAAKKMENVS